LATAASPPSLHVDVRRGRRSGGCQQGR